MRAATQTAPRRLGDYLLASKHITSEQLARGLEHQKRLGGSKLLGEVLVELEYCTEDQVIEALAAIYGIPYAKLDQRLGDPKVVSLLPRDYIEKHHVFPLFKVRGVLTVAVAEPTNLFLIDEISALTKLPTQVVATTHKDVRRMITTLPDSKVIVIDDILENIEQGDLTLLESELADLAEAAEVAGQSPIIRLVNYVIYNAAKEGASDIHIEPAERCIRVRYRIDGRLHKSIEVPLHLLPAITSRIKIMASLDISERRLPQDGRVHVMLEGRKIDLRVSTFPSSRGEKTVIRVLDTRNVSLNLRELGFAEDVLTALQQQIHAPNGIVLVTGPTGSGKSTTLYAAMAEIASMENNICSVEDPIEYHLPLINQFQVQEKVGLTFSRALRTLLRQDPDVIMVGEVRDEDTARTAIQAALTGHLVLTTLHTNDAPSAVTRLLNMGVEPYLISAALNVVLSQRLVRRMCSRCRQPWEAPRSMHRAMQRIGIQCDRLFRGVGCRKCHNSGYSGRLGVHELLIVEDLVRDAIVTSPSILTLRKLAQECGMITMKSDAIRKVQEGLTTLEEVLKIAGDAAIFGSMGVSVAATLTTPDAGVEPSSDVSMPLAGPA